MTASDYPIFFPYGAITTPYSEFHPHRGDDRACPIGTPIVIDGVTIGLTGATGNVTGPHLHIQEWAGDYATTRKPQNAFAPGTVVNIDPSGTQGDGSFGKFITIQTADGWNDSYCHLSQINVSVGQVIGGSMYRDMSAQEVSEDYSNYTNGHVQLKPADPACQDRKENIPSTDGGEFWRGLNNQQLNIIQNLDARIAELEGAPPAPPVDPNAVVITKDSLWAKFTKWWSS